MLFAIPVIQLLIFGYVVTNEIKDAKIAIYDQSKDYITQKISEKLLSSGYFKLEKTINNYPNISKSFKEGKVKLILVYEPGFAWKLEKEGQANIQIIADASDPNNANMLVNYAMAIINSYMLEKQASNTSAIKIIPSVRMVYNENLKGVFLFVPGLMALLLMLISALMTSISITREKELGTMEVLLVSPIKPIQIIIGKVSPYVFLSFINASMIILIGHFVFGLPVLGNVFLLFGETILFILLALSLGILISTLTDSQQVAMMLSLVALMLPTILLSGFIFPIENMPFLLQCLAQVVPPRWFIVIIKSIMLKGADFSYIWKETLVMVGMMSLFIFLSIKKFKVRLS